MRTARAQKELDKVEKREADSVRKAKNAAAAAETQRKGKEERAVLRCTR